VVAAVENRRQRDEITEGRASFPKSFPDIIL
jgi:hypothetical protein